jgi:hypothetical protein
MKLRFFVVRVSLSSRNNVFSAFNTSRVVQDPRRVFGTQFYVSEHPVFAPRFL